MSCLGCGVGGFDVDNFVKIVYEIFINNNLNSANLSFADLSSTDLNSANLKYANLHFADLRSADLSSANLHFANLRSADLNSANLYFVDLRSTDLNSANLENIKTNEETVGISSICPEEGAFIGWKKAVNNTIIKLKIPANAMRSSATTRKCRCSKAKVLEIWSSEGNEVEEAYSNYDSSFLYKKGETVKVDNFDKNRWKECSTGIHFFMTKGEAFQYDL
jgi:hypothetical protein